MTQHGEIQPGSFLGRFKSNHSGPPTRKLMVGEQTSNFYIRQSRSVLFSCFCLRFQCKVAPETATPNQQY